MSQRTYYHSLAEEQSLWNRIKRGLQETHRSEKPSGAYLKEMKVFLPYVVFIDEEKSEIALANRDYRPLGMLCGWIEDRPFRWMKVDMSRLPEMNFVKDEVVNGRNTKCMSLYFLKTPYYDGKEAFDTYLMKLAQLEMACSENFLMPRFIIATRDLYRLKFKNIELTESHKHTSRLLYEEAGEVGRLRRENEKLKAQIEELKKTKK